MRNKVLLMIFIVCVGLLLGGYRFFRQVEADAKVLRVTGSINGDLYLSSYGDGPFVVTHLVVYGLNEPDKKAAALVPPIAVVDSAGVTIPHEQVLSLKWRDYFGNETTAPVASAKIRALYYRAEISR